MQDEQIVQKEGAVLEVKAEGAVSEEAGKPAEVKPPEPFIDERTAQLIADTIRDKSVEIERRFQSISDKRVGQAEFRARQAEARHQAMTATLRGMNPVQADKLRLADYQAQENFIAAMEQERELEKAKELFKQSFNESVTEHIKGLGIDPSDKQIDWAKDTDDYVEKQRRILASVARISKEGLMTKKEDSAKERVTLVNEIEARVRKGLGYDSADTFVSSGGGSGELGSLLSGKTPGQAKKELDKYIKGA